MTYFFQKHALAKAGVDAPDHKFQLGNKIIENLYDILQDLIRAKFSQDKLNQLQEINIKLEILRYQTSLMLI
jgi:hypothetical protein